jgi:hypothetical protein
MTTEMGEVRTDVNTQHQTVLGKQRLKLLKLERSSIVTTIVMTYKANNL